MPQKNAKKTSKTSKQNLLQKIFHKKPASKPSEQEIELQLAKEVRKLTKEVEKLKSLEFIKVFHHPWKFMGFSLLKGIMVGFGTVLGATVLVALFIYLLSQISVVPVIGEFVQDIINEVQGDTQTP